MRLSYSEDEDYPGQFNLWRANCERQIAGKAGQAALREVAVALLTLPEKRLVRDAVAHEGDVCAVGAYIAQKRVAAGEDRATVLADLARCEEYDDTPKLGERHGLPHLVAWKLVCLNDGELTTVLEVGYGPLHRHDATYKGGIPYVRDMTPEERYEQVLAWVQSKIAKDIA